MRKLNLLLLLFLSLSAFSQEDAWVFFSDKPQANSYLSNPLSMLSQRALDRRARYNISLDIKDVPLESSYINSIANSTGITIVGKSKWLNAVHVQGSQANIENLFGLSFITAIDFLNRNLSDLPLDDKKKTDKFVPVESIGNKSSKNFDYGDGYNQIHMLNGDLVHQAGYTGTGVLIAIMDGGFTQANTADVLNVVFNEGRIVDRYNFLDKNQNVFQYSRHGTAVLSDIGSKLSGTLVGTAPDASFALYITEDVSQETPIEETHWLEAAERADSLGADVFNTSLGYNDYDRSVYSYTIDDLDGQTAFISRGADIAVSRGIHVVNSAGNEGLRVWHKITPPADARGIITVGAVDSSEIIAGFSSRGPTVDGRIKPDVVAQGDNAYAYYFGEVTTVSGTSFSSPITAGMVACMVQKNSNINPYDMRQLIIQSADRYATPNNDYGYGVPDFYQVLSTLDLPDYAKDKLKIYPNPFLEYIHIDGYSHPEENYKLLDVSGKEIATGKVKQNICFNQLHPGIYFLQINRYVYKLVKK